MAPSQPDIPIRGEFILAGPETAEKGEKFVVPIVFRIRLDEFPSVPIEELKVEFHLVKRDGQELQAPFGAVLEPRDKVASRRAVRLHNGAAYFVADSPYIRYDGWFGIGAKIRRCRDSHEPAVVGRQVRNGMLRVERCLRDKPEPSNEDAHIMAELRAHGILVDPTLSHAGTGRSQSESGCCVVL
ncbi:hypothetical protein MAPG_09253 [Magnaporthiopsis poae ATCC 64411]|uniref:Uncharacterized protein n=1 Tax=Magnaporthiopsis poae (strain ATCC 64411 / 73-15) TaxID=644358 RepID=A0A0C4E9G8_MAGP6|nr:hypothetical protein MAPG_09253 [Magnaporthiopsis poae ATCC 64411]